MSDAMSELSWLPAWQMADLIARREVSCVELTEAALARIADVQPLLNCFTEVWVDDAVAAARALDKETVGGGVRGPLHGIPIAIKDTTPVAGRRTTLGSYTHEHWVPDEDAYVVSALRRAGAVFTGHTTSPEFASSLVTDSPLWGITRNPWDTTRTTGGSSGGAGAAVASGCVPLAEGTDMGGSVRIPAAWCGVVGVKPSLGRIPMDTLPGLFDSISHHGPLARCVEDARRFVLACQGPDDADVLSIPGPLDAAAGAPADLAGLRIAFSGDLGCYEVAPSVAAAVAVAADRLRDAGAVVTEVDVGVEPADEDAWMQLWGVFMATYYGHHLDEHRERMDPWVVALIDSGRRLTAVDLKGLEIARTGLWRRLRAVFADHEALLCPTMAVGPWPAARADAPDGRAVAPGRSSMPDMTSVFNLVSPCPVASVPVGLDADGLPVGAQIVGRRWRDDSVLALAGALERVVDPIGRPPI
jgi:Asp-tRNA(Asn)/Glu-tRNA(Gln) amidotransferase A subunit family amidase